MEKEDIEQDKKFKEFYGLFDLVSSKAYEKQEYLDDIENAEVTVETSINSEETKSVGETANEETNKKKEEYKKEIEDILENTSLKDCIKMSKTQRKNLNRKLLNKDSKRLFQYINNMNEEFKEIIPCPYNMYIPKDLLDIQVEIKNLRNKLWRQLRNLPKSERTTLVSAIKDNIIKIDSLVNRGRFVKSVRKKSYIEAQSLLFDLKSYTELMREMEYISHAKYINYEMSITKIGKQLTQLIRSANTNNSSKKDVHSEEESCKESEIIEVIQ